MATILVVDDEFGIAEVLDAILSDEGYRVVTAINGRQALEKIAADKPDLILTDVIMPVMDGPAMVTALRERPELSAIPVIVMSVLAEQKVRARVPGLAAFLGKPFRSNTVVRLVQTTLARVGRSPASASARGATSA